ncbi:MAG: hypothetical protein AMXMBFR84_11920 [Candidatus Hydrogenedentota bacterium]
MSGAWALCKRELKGFFLTPVGYVVVGTFAAIAGLYFGVIFIWYSRVTQNPSAFDYNGIPDFEEFMLSPFLVFCGQLIMFLGPLVTMRLIAEERSRGTMELLLTYPLRDRDIILGKYFGSLGIVAVLMSVICIFLVLMGYYNPRVEPSVLVFGLFTVFLMSAAFMSLGLFVSALVKSQITAATTTFGLWFILFILGTAGGEMAPTMTIPESWAGSYRDAAQLVYSVFRQLVLELPLDNHAEDMAQGVFAPIDIAYYILFAAFFLFLTFRALESRKWRA